MADAAAAKDVRKARKAAKRAQHAANKAKLAERRPGQMPGSLARMAVGPDGATSSALSYVAGLLDPVGKGTGARLPSQGLYPTFTFSSFTRRSWLAVVPSAATGTAVAGLVVYPDVKNNWSVITSSTGMDSGFTWGTVNAGDGWSAVSTNSVYFRGCVNMAVRIYNKAPLLKRGGRLLIGHIPPGYAAGALPTDLNTLYASPSTVVLDLGDMKNGYTVFWFPATGEAATFYGSSNMQRGASTWTASTATDYVLGDPRIMIVATTGDNTNVSLDLDFEITLNSEGIAGWGSSQQLLPGRVTIGGPADVDKVIKPVEAAVSSPSVLQQIGNGTLDALKLGGRALAKTGMSLHHGILAGATQFLHGGDQILKGNIGRGLLDMGKGALGTALSFGGLLGAEAHRQHVVAVAFNAPQLDPWTHYGKFTYIQGHPMRLPDKIMTPSAFESALLRHVAATRPTEEKE